jgi:hypothetical protein
MRSVGLKTRFSGVALFCLAAAGAWATQAPVIDLFDATSTVVAPGEMISLTLQAHDPDCPSVCTTGCGQFIRSDLTS